MSIRKASDSWSSCDPSLYSNIYDVRNHPSFNQKIVNANPVSRDTIEISREMLKDDAMKRLKQLPKYVIAQSSFMRIGKYLFIAIAFPPYLLLYGLPKWVLVEALPSIFSVISIVWQNVQKKAKNRMEKSSRYVAKVSQFLQQMTQALIRPMTHLIVEIRQYLWQMSKNVRQFFKQINQRLSFKPFVKAQSKIVESFNYFRNIPQRIKEKLNEKLEKIGSQLQKAIELIKQSPQIFLGWGQTQFLRVRDGVLSFQANWNKPLQTSQDLAKRATEFFLNGMKKGFNEVKANFEPLKRLYLQKLHPHLRSMKENMINKWIQIRDFIKDQRQKALKYVQDKQEVLKKRAESHQFFDWLEKSFIFRNSWIKKWLLRPAVVAFCKRCIELSYSIRISMWNYVQTGLQVFERVTKFANKYWNLFKTKWNELKSTIKNVSVSFGRHCKRAGLLSLYYFLLAAILTGLLIARTFRWLGKLNKSFLLQFKSIVRT